MLDQDTKYLSLMILIYWTKVQCVEIKENNPLHCMCGQAKKGKREPPRDIQVFTNSLCNKNAFAIYARSAVRTMSEILPSRDELSKIFFYRMWGKPTRP